MSIIYRWKHPSIKQHLWGILQGFAEIMDGVVTLSTLGFFASGFERKVAWKRAGEHIKELKKKREAEKCTQSE